MKIYKTQKEIEADIKDGVLTVDGDVKFEVSFSIFASLKIAGNITARDINAGNITAWNITARDITAWDITAWDINAGNINFYAVCFAYAKFVCNSIVGRRQNSKYFSLDGKVKIMPDEKKSLSGKKVKVELDGVSYEAIIQ